MLMEPKGSVCSRKTKSRGCGVEITTGGNDFSDLVA